jgi:hypothetical protein
MEIEVRVCLIDLKRAFRRLIARLPDESEAGADFGFARHPDLINFHLWGWTIPFCTDFFHGRLCRPFQPEQE